MSCTLLSLPSEILHFIAEFLATDHPSSLRAFSRANKQCCEISNRYRIRHISFHAASPKRLARDIEFWKEAFTRHESFAYVQKVTVSGRRPKKEDDDLRDWVGDGTVVIPRLYVGEENPRYWDWGSMSSRHYTNMLGLDNEVNYEGLEGWDPLVKFLPLLSGLQDLVWTSPEQLPPSVLDMLEEKLPRCRLSLQPFAVRSLYQEPEEPQDIDSYEDRLITSPSLSSVVVPVNGIYSPQQVEYNHEMVRLMASGLAPSLSEVYTVQAQPRGLIFHSMMTARRQFRDIFVQRPAAPSGLGRLKLLSIHKPAVDELRYWGNYTDFSHLQTLQLWHVEEPEVLLAAAECEFTSLKFLMLELVPPQDEFSPLDHAAARFLVTVPPLERLQLMGAGLDQTMRAVCETHGASLQCLSYVPVFITYPHPPPTTLDMLHHINESCTNLTDLVITIRRTKGDATEVALYKVLAPLSARVEHLTINLQCVYPDEYEPTSEKADLLVNFAVDETLARSIFSVVAPGPPLSLQSVKLLVVTDGVWGDAKNIANVMRTESTFTRNGSGFDLQVIRGDDCWPDWKKEEKVDVKEEHVDMAEAFRSLWPDQGKGWIREFYSSPLALGE